MWEPWIGKKFKDRKILLLGESCYDWQDTNGIYWPAKADQPIENVEALQKDPWNGAATLKKLTRAICGTETPSPALAASRWDCFAYTNYVPVSAGRGPKRRPSDHSWAQGTAEWPMVLAKVKPRVIMVLGKGLWDYMPTTQQWVTKNIQGYEIEDFGMAMCFAVRHPSFGGPSWSVYAELISALEQFAIDGDLTKVESKF